MDSEWSLRGQGSPSLTTAGNQPEPLLLSCQSSAGTEVPAHDLPEERGIGTPRMKMDQQDGQPTSHPRKHSCPDEKQKDRTPGPPRLSDQGDERSAEAGKANERTSPLRLRTSHKADQASAPGP